MILIGFSLVIVAVSIAVSVVAGVVSVMWLHASPRARQSVKLAGWVAGLAVVGVLFFPPPRSAQARLLDITPEGDSGGYTICVSLGWNGVGIGYCWHTEIPFLSPTPVPRPAPMMPAHESS